MAGETETLGQRIRRLRYARGWTQPQLATAADISDGYISELERDQHPRVGPDKLAKLAAAFGVPLSEFVAGLPDLQQLVTDLYAVNLDAHGRASRTLGEHSPGGSGRRPVGDRTQRGHELGGDNASAMDAGPYAFSTEVPVPGRANGGEGDGNVPTRGMLIVRYEELRGHANVRAVEVAGQSMAPRLMDGCYALIDEDAEPNWTPAREAEQSVVCVTVTQASGAKETLLAYLVAREEDGTLVLRPEMEAPGMGQRRRLAPDTYHVDGVWFGRPQVVTPRIPRERAQGVNWAGNSALERAG